MLSDSNNPVPLSVKVAVTFGAVVGGGLALVQNRERVLEGTVSLLQRGIEFCNDQLEKTKGPDERVAFAADFQDNEYASYDNNGREIPRRRRRPAPDSQGDKDRNFAASDFDEPSTPEGTDTETDDFSDYGDAEDSYPRSKSPFTNNDVDASDMVSLD